MENDTDNYDSERKVEMFAQSSTDQQKLFNFTKSDKESKSSMTNTYVTFMIEQFNNMEELKKYQSPQVPEIAYQALNV